STPISTPSLHDALPISRYLPEVLESLKQRQDIRFIYLDRHSHTEARLAGRKAVDTEFFAFLDDDHEYLPGAAQQQLGAIARDPRSEEHTSELQSRGHLV